MRQSERFPSAHALSELHARCFGLAGFASFGDYQRTSNPMLVVRDVRVPLLILNAADDPICTEQNVRDSLDLVRAMPDTILAVTARGSHCAFFEGAISPASWADRRIAQYLTAVHRMNEGREQPAAVTSR